MAGGELRLGMVATYILQYRHDKPSCQARKRLLHVYTMPGRIASREPDLLEVQPLVSSEEPSLGGNFRLEGVTEAEDEAAAGLDVAAVRVLAAVEDEAVLEPHRAEREHDPQASAHRVAQVPQRELLRPQPRVARVPEDAALQVPPDGEAELLVEDQDPLAPQALVLGELRSEAVLGEAAHRGRPA